MATYGDFPGVKITTQGGGISGIEVGDDEKLFLVGKGDPANGTAPTNDPTKITSLTNADTKFGDGTELADAMKQARANGASREYLYGVMPSAPSDATEQFLTAADHTDASKLSNAPLVEDTGTITVLEDTSGDGSFSASSDTELAVEFRYETNQDDTSTDFTSLSPASDTVYINPLTGEWVADASGDYQFEYDYLDWDTAIGAVDAELNEGETAIVATLSEAPDVHTSLAAKVNTLRDNFMMAQGVAGARPNKTGDDGTYDAEFDTSTYTDTVSNDSLYLIAPARFNASKKTLIGAMAGLMAGHTITDPIYNDSLTVSNLPAQSLTKTGADNLRAEDVMPIRSAGDVRVPANRSTAYSGQTDWKRDFWRRRIVDRVILLSKQVGDRTIGLINDEDSQEKAETLIYSELEEMASNRLLKENEQGEVNWRVEVVDDPNDSDQVNIDVGVTPQGIVKRIDQNITIST